jgi:hypothetical protein
MNQERSSGWLEAYYKALRQEIPASSYPTVVPTAWAVGKINIPLQGTTSNPGKNLASVPFVPNSRAVKDVFGEGATSPWSAGDVIQFKDSAAPAYLAALYTSGNQWKDAANSAADPSFDIDLKYGNVIITNSNKTTMVLGNVPVSNENIVVFGGAGIGFGGKTLLGQVYPAPIGLAGSSLFTDGARDGDMVQCKDSPLNQVYVTAVARGGVWLNAVDNSPTLDPKIGTMTIPNSYIYVRYGDLSDPGFTWRKVKPY